MSILDGLRGGFATEREQYQSKGEIASAELERVETIAPGLPWQVDKWGKLFIHKDDFPFKMLQEPDEVYTDEGDLQLISCVTPTYKVYGVVTRNVYSEMIRH